MNKKQKFSSKYRQMLSLLLELGEKSISRNELNKYFDEFDVKAIWQGIQKKILKDCKSTGYYDTRGAIWLTQRRFIVPKK